MDSEYCRPFREGSDRPLISSPVYDSVDATIKALNKAGFVLSVFQGSYTTGFLVDPKAPKYLWHGSIYSADRHSECSRLRRELPWEELVKQPCFFYQHVTHHKDSFEEAINDLWRQYLNPEVPPRAVRSSPNPAFLRHKKKVARQPITDDDLLA